MKKRIAVLLVLGMLLTACGREAPDDLMRNVPARILCVQTDLDAGAAAAADFGVRLLQTAMEPEGDTLISPLSVLCALAMTANGADGNTLAQMEQVLGMEPDALNSFMLTCLERLPDSEDCSLKLANSIWFRDDPRFTVEQSFLETNAGYYHAGAYRAAFDDATKDAINRWVSEYTGGMIPQILEEIPEDAVMYLVNALAIEAEWQEVYEKHQVREDEFYLEDGSSVTVDMMHSEEPSYLHDDLATGFLKYYKDGSYAFAALLPNEGVSVREYVNSLTGEHLMELLSEPENIKVFAAMPKFETEYSVEMSGVLQEMGMSDAFDWRIADFSRLGRYDADGVNLCISRVLHKTFLSVSEQGTRAGAATAVEMRAEGAPLVDEYRSVTLDRPFVYLLIDCRTNLPIFMGTRMTAD